MTSAATASPRAERAEASSRRRSVKAGDARGRASLREARAPEAVVALDMIKLAVFFAAPLLAAGAAVWGWSGAASVTLAVAIVLVNFALGAAMIALGARLGGSAMAAAVTGGYLLRLGIVAVAVLPVADHDWFEIAPFAVSLLVTHLGLLAVETRRVSLSLAFPGLKPDVARRPATSADATAARAGAPAVGSASADALGAVEERPS